jgi:riboflavin kinase/FMN adenylyltransferase
MDFLRILQKHGNMGFMAVGGNFRCGYQLDTGVPKIQEFNDRHGIQTCVVQPLTEGGQQISSSQIRSAVAKGKLLEAAAMLGRPFTVDFCGAAASSGKTAGSDITYDIAGQGRILPPPGRYSAFLYKKKYRQSLKTPVDILIEGGNVIISGDSVDDKTCPEHLEFLPL